MAHAKAAERKTYEYGVSLRPPSHATVPQEGWIGTRSSSIFKHGVVQYSRYLTQREIDTFELVALDPYYPSNLRKGLEAYTQTVIDAFTSRSPEGYIVTDKWGTHVLSNSTRSGVDFQVTDFDLDMTPTGHRDYNDFAEAVREEFWARLSREERERVVRRAIGIEGETEMGSSKKSGREAGEAAPMRSDVIDDVQADLRSVRRNAVSAKQKLFYVERALDHFWAWGDVYEEVGKKDREYEDIVGWIDDVKGWLHAAQKEKRKDLETAIYKVDADAGVGNASREALIDILVSYAQRAIDNISFNMVLPDVFEVGPNAPQAEGWYTVDPSTEEEIGPYATRAEAERMSVEMKQDLERGIWRDRGAHETGEAVALKPSIVYAKIDELKELSGLTFVPDVVKALEGEGYKLESIHRVLSSLARHGHIELRPESGLNRLTPEQKKMCLPGPQGSVLSWIRDTREGKTREAGEACGCAKGEKSAADFPEDEDALKAGLEKYKATHWAHTSKPRHEALYYVYTPTSRGAFERRVIYEKKGLFHFAKTFEMVATLPKNAIELRSYMSQYGGREAGEAEEHSASERRNVEKVIAAFRQGKAAKGDSKGTISTDGDTIYSYAMKIAWREGGAVHVVDRKEAPSATTRAHIDGVTRAFAQQLRHREMGKIAGGDKERWKATLSAISDRIRTVATATQPWAKQSQDEIKAIENDLVAAAGVYNDWLIEQGITKPQIGRRKKEAKPIGDARLLDAANELRAAYDSFDEPYAAFPMSRLWRARDVIQKVIADDLGAAKTYVVTWNTRQGDQEREFGTRAEAVAFANQKSLGVNSGLVLVHSRPGKWPPHDDEVGYSASGRFIDPEEEGHRIRSGGEARRHRRGAQENPASLGHRSSWELRVIGYLEDALQPQTDDPLMTAALTVDNFKRNYSELWRSMMEDNLHPQAVADTMLRVRDREAEYLHVMGKPARYEEIIQGKAPPIPLSKKRRARENPIDTGDGVPWVKIARDPDQFKAAMKQADKIGPVDGCSKIYDLLGPAMLKEDQEVFLAVLLDVRQQCRGVVEVHRGERSRVGANMTDIIRAAVNGGAEGLIVCHNHPSGKAMPSDADKELTKAIEKACRVVDITFVDHVILGNGEYYSFADRKRYKAKAAKASKAAAK